jgi:hypothetical protein
MLTPGTNERSNVGASMRWLPARSPPSGLRGSPDLAHLSRFRLSGLSLGSLGVFRDDDAVGGEAFVAELLVDGGREAVLIVTGHCPGVGTDRVL